MTRWLKITLLRLFVALAMVVLLIWLLVWRPTSQAKAMIKRQKSITNNSSEVASQELVSLPAISQIKTQEIGNFSAYTYELEQLADKLKKNQDGIEKGKLSKIIGLSISRSSKVITDTNKQTDNKNMVIKISSTDLSSAYKLTVYQAQVFSALTNVLEYNPTEDTANFKLGTNDTSKRLTLAEQGMAKTEVVLQKLKGKYPDMTLQSVISQITFLQNARAGLALNGDTSAWINSVYSAQQTIVQNRQRFWIKSAEKSINKLTDDDQSLQKLANQWKMLTYRYSVK